MTNGSYDDIYVIDLEKEVLGSDSDKEQFISAILYGASNEIHNKFQRNLGINLYSYGVYDIIKETKFTEELGVYYQEELQQQIQKIDTSTTVMQPEGAEEPDTNKTKKRVITYTQVNN